MRTSTMTEALSASLVLLTLCCVLSDHAKAQQERSRTGRSAREAYEATKARERNIQNREMIMQGTGTEASEKQLAERLKVLSAQARQDFRRMQIVNNNMMRGASVDPSLNYKLIVDATGEINKCARRLKTNLAALGTDEERKQKKLDQLNPALLKRALFSLDELIMNFVTSLAVVDTENRAQSRNYLQDIIELSDHLRRNAERIDKSTEKR